MKYHILLGHGTPTLYVANDYETAYTFAMDHIFPHSFIIVPIEHNIKDLTTKMVLNCFVGKNISHPIVKLLQNLYPYLPYEVIISKLLQMKNKDKTFIYWESTGMATLCEFPVEGSIRYVSD